MRPLANLKQLTYFVKYSARGKIKTEVFKYSYNKNEQQSQQPSQDTDKLTLKFPKIKDSGRLVLIDQNQHPNYERWEIQNACLFFCLKLQQIYQIDQLVITQIFQKQSNPKFNLAVVRAYSKKSNSNIPVIMVSTYKTHCISQLIRIEMVYRKIQGMITYHKNFDFYGFLTGIQKQLQENGKKKQQEIETHKYQEQCNTRSNF